MKKKYCITMVFKMLIIQIILNFVGLIFGYIWALNVENKKWNQLIYNNIKIADINLGGKTKEEARNIIKHQYIDNMLDKKLSVTIDNDEYSIENARLIKSYDIDSSLDEAFKFGKESKVFQKHKFIKNGTNKSYNLHFIYDEDALNEFVVNIEKQANKNPINASVEVNFGSLIKINADTKGHKLEKEKLKEFIKDRLETEANKDTNIYAPIEEIEATITQNQLLSIDTCIASFSTSFETSSWMRINNIDICVKTINGKILMPGDVFSFNEVVGERTKERGYMEAPVVIGDKIELGIGGGICQVSSTLYNAITRAGIKPLERASHSLPTSYVQYGQDATVDWENIDFKFQNTLGYPMYIEGYTKDKKLYVNIFSNSCLNNKDIYN